MNSSKHRSNQSIMKGDLVIARKIKRNKFDPYYDTTQYIVITNDNAGGLLLKRVSDNHILWRHQDDIKLVTLNANSSDYQPYVRKPITYTWECPPQIVVAEQNHDIPPNFPINESNSNMEPADLPQQRDIPHFNIDPYQAQSSIAESVKLKQRTKPQISSYTEANDIS